MAFFTKFKLPVGLFLVFALAFTPPVWAAGGRIAGVSFVGLSKVDEASVRRSITSLPGHQYSEAAVRKDIQTLIKAGFFEDVTVESQDTSDGVRLIFHVQEKAVVGAVTIKGNKKVKTKDLKAAITQRDHNLLDQKRLTESIEAIRKLYQEKDESVADISYSIQPLDTEKNEVEVVFNIIENKNLRIKRISFVGNKAFTDKKLASKLLLKVKGPFSFVSGSGKLKDEKLEADIKRLAFFYQDQGYARVVIGEPQLSVTRDKKSIYITFLVHEGEKYKIGSVNIVGDIITTKEELLSKLKLKAGVDYAMTPQFEDVTTLNALYWDQAYAFAAIEPVLTTNESTKTADVTYTINKGRKIYINRIIIEGNKFTRDKVIRRELMLRENAPYVLSAQEESKRRLFQLGFFEDVNFSIPGSAMGDRVNLVVRVKEKATGSFQLGAGFSSLESFVFTASVAKDNFLGLGIRGSLSTSLSKLRQEFSVNMLDRYFLDTRWIVSASAYRYSSALNRDFDQKAFGGSLTFGREVFPHFDVNMGYKIEDIAVNNFSAQVPVFFQRNSSGLTSSLVASMAFDTRDNRLSASRGMFHSVSGEFAGNQLGGDNDYWKASVESRVFFPAFLKTVVKARGLFSYINSLGNDPVPLFERFFMGGVNTLRGFDLNSIGPTIRVPRTATGGDQTFTYGGNRMVLFNLEYEVPIYLPAGLKAVAFLDTGQAFGESENISFSKFRSDYGFGFRWNAPFGPMRFEWGFPIAKKSGESSTVFNFVIGQSF